MPAVPPAQRDVDASGWRALGRELGGLATRFAGESASFSLAAATSQSCNPHSLLC